MITLYIKESKNKDDNNNNGNDRSIYEKMIMMREWLNRILSNISL